MRDTNAQRVTYQFRRESNAGDSLFRVGDCGTNSVLRSYTRLGQRVITGIEVFTILDGQWARTSVSQRLSGNAMD